MGILFHPTVALLVDLQQHYRLFFSFPFFLNFILPVLCVRQAELIPNNKVVFVLTDRPNECKSIFWLVSFDCLKAGCLKADLPHNCMCQIRELFRNLIPACGQNNLNFSATTAWSHVRTCKEQICSLIFTSNCQIVGFSRSSLLTAVLKHLVFWQVLDFRFSSSVVTFGMKPLF